MRITRKSTTALVTSAILVALGGTAYGASESKSEAAPSLLSYGQPGEGAEPLPDKLAPYARTAAGLIDEHDDDFAGSLVDPDRNVLIIRVVTDEGRELVAKSYPQDAPIEVVSAPVSHLQQMEEFRALVDDMIANDKTFLERITSFGINGPGDGWILNLKADLTDNQKTALEARLTSPLLVVVEVPVENSPDPFDDRKNDQSPYAGGFRYGIASNNNPLVGRCSSAFGFEQGGEDYILTAGHCFVTGTNYDRLWSVTGPDSNMSKNGLGGIWNGRTSMAANYTSKQMSDNKYHGDVALVNVSNQNNSVQGQMWDGGASTSNKSAVTSRDNPTLNDLVCIGGSETGSSCGYTTQLVNFDFPVPGGWLRNIDEARKSDPNACSRGGDSGGSIYRHNGTEIVAVGVISGHTEYTDACTQRFTGAEEAIEAWGGHIKQAS